MVRYHNVRVFFNNGTASLYHNVTNYVGLIDYLQRNAMFNGRTPIKAFIYRKHNRKADHGEYVGSWHLESGFKAN